MRGRITGPPPPVEEVKVEEPPAEPQPVEEVKVE